MQLTSIKKTLLPNLLKKQWSKEVFDTLWENKKINIKGAVGSSISLIIAECFVSFNRFILIILDDKNDALYATADLEELCGKENVLYFPAASLKSYQIEKEKNANIVMRTEVINQLYCYNSPKVIVTYASAISEKVLKKEEFEKKSYAIKVGDQLDFDLIDELLNHYKFNQTDFVSQPGEFSVRGGIIDIFSYAYESPFRVSLFGNKVDSIRTFDIESQLTQKKVDEFKIVSDIQGFLGNTEKISLFEILPKDTIVFTRNAFLVVKNIFETFSKSEDFCQTLDSDIKDSDPKSIFVSEDEFLHHINQFTWVDFTSHKLKFSCKEIQLKHTQQPIFNKKFEWLIQDLQDKLENGYDVWISFSSEKEKERLENIFENLERNIPFRSFTSDLHEGFVDNKNKISVYTDHQIFGRCQRYKEKNSFAKSEQLTLKKLISLKVGDYITHIDHGIGKFMGLAKVNNNGKVQECFKLSYKNGDLLYVSIHALHKISKYNGPDGKEVILSKLGSSAWKNLKKKTKAKVKQIAFDLIKLYAQRKNSKGFSFSPDGYMQNELEASFIYEDTPDQEKATMDIKLDMQADTIMDRLVCGDVGFGKTEVAIRAAFKATVDGKQVAILVPTTILAFQHYRSFKERLKNFPVEISYLNRFRTAKQKKEILELLASGKIDIVIGTHQLVGASVKFKDLGLLIIDEEHKFGVAIKDKIKAIKNDVDTLTLTATPIPRTLQFSLMAARDLSVIRTPPPNRQPVETRLIGFDKKILKEAISYEIQRNGQVYFINNRIENLKEIAELIQQLIPDARVITGHGKLNGKELEDNMMDFMEGKYDVLVSTTIVESGLDVPNANTIFINDAQLFGMADLHQMRGRVGRSQKKAFCYLITPPIDLISTDSRKRLQVIEQFSDLGSGFHIAMKDLEIRGAGDLLGGDQSGFINEMGFDTYQKIMHEALDELNNEDMDNLFQDDQERNKLFNSTKNVSIDTDFELMLPDDYVNSTEERLLLYQKLSEVKNFTELNRYEYELKDRFGILPKEAVNLLKSIELKWLTADVGFEKIVMKNGVFLGYFPSNPHDRFYQSEKFKKIIQYVSQNPHHAQLKEKYSSEGNQLIMRKERVSNVEDVNDLLTSILN